MKQKILIISLLLFPFTAFSQIDSLEIKELKQTVIQLKTELKSQKADFSKQQSETNKNINDLRSEIANERENIATLADSLGVKIVNTQTNAEQQIHSVRQTVSKNTLYWIIAALTIALLCILLFWLLRRKLKSDKADMIEQLNKAKSAIEENLIKEFGKQTELMDEQLKVIKKQKEKAADVELDHSLVLKVADEITLIERNISHMNPETKGLKPLIRAVERLKDNLLSKGYEIPELLGMTYVEGMKVNVISSLPDETLKEGKDIITKVIKPQVNYNEKLIQMAQVEVSVGINK